MERWERLESFAVVFYVGIECVEEEEVLNVYVHWFSIRTLPSGLFQAFS